MTFKAIVCCGLACMSSIELNPLGAIPFCIGTNTFLSVYPCPRCGRLHEEGSGRGVFDKDGNEAFYSADTQQIMLFNADNELVRFHRLGEG